MIYSEEILDYFCYKWQNSDISLLNFSEKNKMMVSFRLHKKARWVMCNWLQVGAPRITSLAELHNPYETGSQLFVNSALSPQATTGVVN